MLLHRRCVIPFDIETLESGQEVQIMEYTFNNPGKLPEIITIGIESVQKFQIKCLFSVHEIFKVKPSKICAAANFE